MHQTAFATTCAGGNEMGNNPQRQLAVPEPEPLSTCPGRRLWQHFRGKPYLVFVDESFRGFFEFDRRGYFVHGTVGIPEERYSDVQREVAPTFEDFRRLTSAGAKEFK